MIRLILCDIDNTIMPSGKMSVSDKTIEAFHAAQAAGIHVGPCSGRGYEWIGGFFKHDSASIATSITSNGLQIHLDGKVLREDNMPRETMYQLKEVLRDFPGVGLLAFDGKTPRLVHGSLEVLHKIYPSYAAIIEVEEPGWELPEEIVKANLFMDVDIDETARIVDEVNRRVDYLDFDVALRGYSNIMAPGRNKGSALISLREALGLTPDEVMVFGDGENDLAMFAETPHAVAVANATENVKRAANHHIGYCKDDAVADTIFELARGRWPF